jgi:AcrR family transcriptional regulator
MNWSTRTRRPPSLLDVATDVLVAEPGATLATIATAAGISRTTLHSHYPSREALLRAVAERAMGLCADAISDAGATTGGDLLAAVVAALVPVGAHLAFLWRNPSFDHDPELGARWLEIEGDLREVLQVARSAGSLPADLPDWWSVHALFALVYVASENIYLGRLAPLDAPGLVLTTLTGRS